MKNKRNIYCEYRFWEAFFEMEEQVLRNRNKRRLWDAFYEFLAHNNLFFNVSLQSINPNSCGGKNLNEILHARGGAGIEFIPQQFPKFEEISNEDDIFLNSVFLTMLDDKKCKSVAKKIGVMVLNLQMVLSSNHIYYDNKISFDKINRHNWSCLLELKAKYPSISHCNSLVIADKYLLSSTRRRSAFELNLRPIFDALLPFSLGNDIVFTICILSENQIGNVEEKLSKIEEVIRDLRPRLIYKINLFNSWDMHDRSILTNNIILTSGAGFDVIGENRISNKLSITSLCFPFLQISANDSITYLDWINNILNAKGECNIYQRNYWGDEKTSHHLLDYYYERPATVNRSYPSSRWNGFNPRGVIPNARRVP